MASRSYIRTKKDLTKKTKYLSQTHKISHSADNALIFENLIDKKTVAKMLNVSLSFIDKAVRRNTIPHYKFGKLVRFDMAEIAAHFKKERKCACDK